MSCWLALPQAQSQVVMTAPSNEIHAEAAACLTKLWSRMGIVLVITT